MQPQIRHLRIAITRFTDDHQPGFVECHVKDASGNVWTFINKVPVVSAQDLDANSVYPQPGEIACVVLEEFTDPQGRTVVVVNTKKPWGIATDDGTSVFKVFAEQLV